MDNSRSELRKKIMTILYQISIYEKNKLEYNIEDIIKKAIDISNTFVSDTVNGVLKYKDNIDKIANENLNNWTIDRLGYTDQAILRIGIYELIYTDIPEVIAINEAVELSKIYSDDDVRKMINATMDKIYKGKK